MNATPSFRIHPAVGFARLGNSEDYYLAPETSAGLPVPGSTTLGGLPIRAGTEAEPITSADLRDSVGAVKRQAARFKIYAYPAEAAEKYPRGDGEEVRIGTRIGTRTVTDMVWTVHLANKKSNAYNVVVSKGPDIFAGTFPPGLRNPFLYGDADDPVRCQKLVIDPGPRAIRGVSADPVAFDTKTAAAFGNERGEVEALPNYPRNFPTVGTANAFPAGGQLDTLGQLRTDAHGRLLVLGGRSEIVDGSASETWTGLISRPRFWSSTDENRRSGGTPASGRISVVIFELQVYIPGMLFFCIGGGVARRGPAR
jgi:hypothetical protein